MFIELAEYLRCPRPHEDTFLVLSTGAMKDRHVLFGTIGCPVCHAEFPVMDGIARFSQRPKWPEAVAPLPDPDAVHAVLGLQGPGGYVVLVGSATGLVADLGGRLEGVHLICLNPMKPVPWDRTRSVLHATDYIPLRDSVARGVIMGAETLAPPWTAEAARVLLRGLRIVTLSETVPPPPGVEVMAAGKGMWVGKKREGRHRRRPYRQSCPLA